MGTQSDIERYRVMSLPSALGPLEIRRYEPISLADAGAIFIGGVGRGFDTPAWDLYPRLCAALVERGAVGLRLRLRKPTDVHESSTDVLAATRWLVAHGVRRVALVGHSLGGAAVIDAGSQNPSVVLVVALAPQAHGTQRVRQLSPRMLVLVHGTDNRILPAQCSREIYERAGNPKALFMLEGAGHTFDEVGERVFQLTLHELDRFLLGAAGAGASAGALGLP